MFRANFLWYFDSTEHLLFFWRSITWHHRRSRKTSRSFNFVPRAPRNWEHARRARCREFSFRFAVDYRVVCVRPCGRCPRCWIVGVLMPCAAVTVVGDGDTGGWNRERNIVQCVSGMLAVGLVTECAKGMAIPRAALPCIERAHVSLMQPDKYLSIT